MIADRTMAKQQQDEMLLTLMKTASGIIQKELLMLSKELNKCKGCMSDRCEDRFFPGTVYF